MGLNYFILFDQGTELTSFDIYFAMVAILFNEAAMFKGLVNLQKHF